jgi:hypothetical protein
LSRASLALLEDKRAAHAAWVQYPSAQRKRIWRVANNAAKRGVAKDVRRYAQDQACLAAALLQQHRVREWSKHIKHMAGKGGSAGRRAPGVLLDSSGQRQCELQGFLRAFTQHFEGVLGGGRALDSATYADLDRLVVEAEAQQLLSPRVECAEGDLPTVEEVCACVKVLRNAATPGQDGFDATMLKANPIMVRWLHRVIVAVWKSGLAPAEWKRAIIVPLHKKGEKQHPGNWRGISLLSIPGKVYTLLLLHRVGQQLEGRLHEAQCGFRPGRGTVDAMFVVRQLVAKSREFRSPLAMAFIDLAKAYDTINRTALWQVLAYYGVDHHIISLLRDLHTGTQAAVRLDGTLGEWFDVTSGVRQGCVIAPLLFNVFMDFVVRQALKQMPDGCGVGIRWQQHDGTCRDSSADLQTLAFLLYADDMVLFAHDPHQLASMLLAMDATTAHFGMCINAQKTEIMLVDLGVAATPPTVVLAGGLVKVVKEFKYLGGWLENRGSVDKEVAARRGSGFGVFNSLEGVWGNRYLKVCDKVAVYKTFVLPVFLYGAETWNCTAAHTLVLERAHSACLRRLLKVSRSEHHTLDHLRDECGLPPIELLLIKRTMQWYGHVARMPEERMPLVMLNSTPAGGHRPRGRPLQTHRSTLQRMFEQVGVEKAWFTSWQERARNRTNWRSWVKGLRLGKAPPDPAAVREQPSRACKRGTISGLG